MNKTCRGNCETDSGRLLTIIVVERGEKIRVVTAYDPDAGQKRDYLTRRVRGEGCNEKETD